VAVSVQFAEFVLDLLGGPRRVRTRRMFGAMGYYSGELFFAIADDDMLWFKVDDASRGAYEAEGMPGFDPMGTGRPMGYYAVPPRLYDEPEELREWMRRALEAAAAAAVAKRKPRAAGASARRRAR
jgi:DNA transformation protein